MRIGAALVLGACAHAEPATVSNTPPANHTDEVVVTHMVVQLNEYYDDMCKVQHHVAVAMDGKPAVVLASKIDCPPPPQIGPNGGRIVVMSSGPNGYVEATFDVPPGHHTFDVIDRESPVTGHIEGDFPIYEGKGSGARPPVDHFGITVNDKELRLLGFSYGFVSM